MPSRERHYDLTIELLKSYKTLKIVLIARLGVADEGDVRARERDYYLIIIIIIIKLFKSCL